MARVLKGRGFSNYKTIMMENSENMSQRGKREKDSIKKLMFQEDIHAVRMSWEVRNL